MISFFGYDLETIGGLAAIGAFVNTLVGAFIGIYGYAGYRMEFRRKRRALEAYLAAEKRKDEATGGRGQRSMLNIIRHVGLTEDEILRISFASAVIDRRLSRNETDGFADRLLFEYTGRS